MTKARETFTEHGPLRHWTVHRHGVSGGDCGIVTSGVEGNWSRWSRSFRGKRQHAADVPSLPPHEVLAKQETYRERPAWFGQRQLADAARIQRPYHPVAPQRFLHQWVSGKLFFTAIVDRDQCSNLVRGWPQNEHRHMYARLR